ncbi:MAG: DegV family protein [Syntrophomonadales bacterium]
MIRVITDSGCDLPVEILAENQIEMVPLKVTFEDGESYLDRVEISPREFREKMYRSKELPKTAAPDPNTFMEVFRRALDEAGEAVCICISSGLSSTYQSAVLARDMLETEKIRIIDSLSASLGEGVLAIRAAEMARQGLSLDTIFNRLVDYRDNLKTVFTLDTLENVIKGGRLTKFQGLVGSILDIKPIFQGVEGKIEVLEKLRGRRRALRRLTALIGEMTRDVEKCIIGISHMDCLEEALELKKEIEKIYSPARIIIAEMGSTLGTYAGKGGIITAF